MQRRTKKNNTFTVVNETEPPSTQVQNRGYNM